MPAVRDIHIEGSPRRRAKDILPVGDPEQTLALAKHAAGVTQSQDKHKAKDGTWVQVDKGQWNGPDGAKAVSIGNGRWSAKVPGSKPGNEFERNFNSLAEARTWAESKSQAKDAERWADEHYNFDSESEAKQFARLQSGKRTAVSRNKFGWTVAVGAKATDVLPIPIKTSNAVPMPTENDGVPRYASARDMKSPEELTYVELEKEIDQLSSNSNITKLENARLRFLTDEEMKRKKAKAKDAKSQWQPDSANHEKLDQLHNEVTGKGYKLKYTAGHGQGVMQHVYRKGGSESNRPTAIIHEKKSGAHEVNYTNQSKPKTKEELAARATDHSGSEPQDHMLRAAQYEVANDRARALDSYRAAASGFRRLLSSAKATDEQAVCPTCKQKTQYKDGVSKLHFDPKDGQVCQGSYTRKPANDAVEGLTKARDGITACQTAFAQQYDHPGMGRTKVCDSAEQALRTAVERTRAGEAVVIVGKTVRPGRVGDGMTSYKVDPNDAHIFIRDPNRRESVCKTCKRGESAEEHKQPAKDSAPPKQDRRVDLYKKDMARKREAEKAKGKDYQVGGTADKLYQRIDKLKAKGVNVSEIEKAMHGGTSHMAVNVMLSKLENSQAKDASCPMDKIPHPFVYDDDADDGSCADCYKKKNDPVHTSKAKAKDREIQPV